MMFYNKDMFAAAGVPEPKPGWTTAEFLDAAKKLTTGGKYAIAPNPNDLAIESEVLALTAGVCSPRKASSTSATPSSRVACSGSPT